MDNGGSPRRFRGIPFGLLAAAVLAYAVLRAVKTSITFDEAATYITYLSSNVFAVFNLTSSDNHFLYTLFARVSSALAGSSEPALRLPSLLGLALYLWFSWAILNRLFARPFALAGLVLLGANLFVLDFFSVGRGYGLALGFEMAALHYFLVFLDPETRSRGGAPAALVSALWAAFASALAHLAFLNMLMSLWIFGLFFALLESRSSRPRTAAGPPPQPAGRPGAKRLVAAFALAIPFNLAVVGQYVRFSEKLIAPVSVRLHGLEPEDMRRVIVCGDDTFDREVEFTVRDGVWTIPRIIPLKRLKLGLTVAGLGRLSGADIDVGDETLRFSGAEIRTWKRLSREDLEYFLTSPSIVRRRAAFRDFEGVMNWAGNGEFWRAYAREAAPVLAVGALLIGLVFGLGRLAGRLRRFGGPGFRPVIDSAGLAALYLLYPIFAMRRNATFYYGGQASFIKETVGSLISESFYGIRYSPRQESAVLIFIAGTVVLFLLMFGAARLRRKTPVAHREAFSIFALMTIAALLIIGQHAIFRVPYLMGRTAVLFVPLYTLFFLFFLRDIGHLGGAWRPAAGALLAAVVALSVYHGIHAANLDRTRVWYYDADTKQMVRDVVSLRAADLSGKPRVRLGVNWVFWAASEYYRRTDRLSWLDISMLPTARRCDLFYLTPDGPEFGARTAIKTYPRTGNVLAR